MNPVQPVEEMQPAEITSEIPSDGSEKTPKNFVVIYCCSGSGNSLWVAREVAKRLKRDVKILPVPLLGGDESPLNGSEPKMSVDAATVGFVFPVHAWAPPRRLRQFIRSLDWSSAVDVFAVATHAGQPARALHILDQDLRHAGFSKGLRVGMNLRMPSNFGKMEIREACRGHIESALEKIDQVIVPAVVSGQSSSLECGNLFQRAILSTLNPLCVPGFRVLGRFFFSDHKCSKCGLCAQLCPRKNIQMTEQGPKFGTNCELCVACFQRCPARAIQYSKASHRSRRYVHPDVSLESFLMFQRQGEVVRSREISEEKV